MVLTNPPFGKKSSMTIVNDEGEVEREDLDRRARRLLGLDLEQAAQLRPARQDAARRSTAGRRWSCPTTCCSRAARARRSGASCSHECDVHTLLRLPTGIFYAQGVKANVLFFDRKPARRDAVDAASSGSTTCAPTSTSRSSRTRSRYEHLEDFVAVLPARTTGTTRVESERFQRFTLRRAGRARQGQPRHLLAAGRALEDTDNLPPPDVIAAGDRRGPRGGARRVRCDRIGAKAPGQRDPGEDAVKAQETTLQQLVQGEKQFLVPLYQRPYSWREAQA